MERLEHSIAAPLCCSGAVKAKEILTMRNVFAKRLTQTFLLILVLYHPCIAAGQNPADPKPAPRQEQVPTQPNTSSASEGISRQQADAILNELRQIRQLLEKQQALLARSGASQPNAPPPPQKVQINVDDRWYSIGRADAPVTIVEFSDFQCPSCKKFHADAYAELKKSYIDTGKVRFVSRDLPLERLHPYALKAAEAARCAGDQNKFWEYRSAIFSAGAALNDDVLKKSAEGLSLDTKVFQACLDSEKHKADVQKDVQEAVELQIMATPTFVLARSTKDKLDGVRITGAQSFATLQSTIETLLKN
jgi:protein-disulfide isomerase